MPGSGTGAELAQASNKVVAMSVAKVMSRYIAESSCLVIGARSGRLCARECLPGGYSSHPIISVSDVPERRNQKPPLTIQVNKRVKESCVA
jgi:hypothetical protein